MITSSLSLYCLDVSTLASTTFIATDAFSIPFTMAYPITYSITSDASTTNSTLVILETEESFGGESARWKDLIASVPAGAKEDFKAENASTLVFYPSNADNTKATRVIFVGLGKAVEVDDQKLRVAAHKGVAAAIEAKAVDITISIPPVENGCALSSIVVGASLTNYKWDKYITDDSRKLNAVKTVQLLVAEGIDVASSENVVKQASVVANAVNFCRDMGNERPAVGCPAWYEDRAKEIADASSQTELIVLQFEELKKLGMGLIVAVGQAAKSKPRLVMMKYTGNPDSKEYTALVGKGITFDTGGINLKTNYQSIFNMYMDMCGTATVLGAMKALTENNVKTNVIGVCCLADNAIDGDAYYPSDIVKSYKGLTVEIGNTDAEGRLVMADGLAYVQKHFPVDRVIDMATLTGASITALGETTANLFSNDEELPKSIEEHGKKMGESFWRMPINDEHRENMKSDNADLNNLSKKAAHGGSCTAAAFLENFIEDNVKWAHIDFAGPASFTQSRNYYPKGPTGFAVMTLYSFLSS